MRALVFEGPGKKSLQNKEIPIIVSATDAIVKITRTTICGTDLHILEGDVPSCSPGRILGHEGVGIIEEVGVGVTRFKKGDHVLISCISSCGKCEYCRRGMYSHCTTGGWMLGNTIDGTQAEFVRIPHADTSLYPIPKGADEEALVMLSDILPTGFECGVLNGKVAPGNTVAIVGAGPIGLAALLTAQFYSPARIIVIDVDQSRLDVALRFGATDIINATGEAAIQKVFEIAGSTGVDTAIEAVGVPATFELCEEIIAPGGVIANIGVHGTQADLHLEKLWSHNISITTRLVDTITTPMLLRTVQAGKIDPKRLITHRFKLDDVIDAYDTFSHASKTKAIKVIIETNAAVMPNKVSSIADDALEPDSTAKDNWDCMLGTRSGLIFHVRRVNVTDEQALKEFFSKVSAEDLSFRFLSGAKEISHQRMLSMIDIDHKQKENFLAVLPDNNNVIATAMLACDPRFERGEVAISVRADFKGKGVAWELLRHIARYAEAQDVKLLEAIESRENHEAIELEREQGFSVEPYPDDATLLLVSKRLQKS